MGTSPSTPSDPDRTRRIRTLFEAALERPPEERAGFLSRLRSADAAGLRRAGVDGPVDAELVAEVEELLAHYEPAATEDLFPTLLEELPPAPSLVGEEVGPYRVRALLGEGGIGAVYFAERPDLDLRVALKVLRLGRLASADQVKRFLLEGRILARLDHPDIARVLDAGFTAERIPYLVMEYVAGEPIDRWARDRQLGVEERVHLLARVCEAVGYAHRNGVVHRDLKPGNVFVTGEGRPKLLDFGIAKLIAPDPAEATATGTHRLIATPAYAAPEQIRGEEISPATDVYALGILLYELLAGRRPYTLPLRRSAEIERIVCQEPVDRPSRHLRGPDARRLRSGLDAVVLQALEKSPARRYPDAGAMAEDLRRWRRGAPVRATRSRAALRRPAGVAAGVLGAVALLALLGLGISTLPADRENLQPEDTLLDATAPSRSVTVFRFETGDAPEYLGEGVAGLLGRALDGAADLRTVPISSIAPRRERGPPTAPAAARLVREAGVDFFILGSVRSDSGGLRIEAELRAAAEGGGARSRRGNPFDRMGADREADRKPRPPVARAVVRGDEDRLFSLADRLAADLLANRLPEGARRVARSAARTTASLVAYRAFLEGERLQGLGSYGAALEAYRRAVATDSTFALAWFRLSQVATTTGPTALMHAAAEAAFRHSAPLGRSDSLLVAGWLAARRGRYREAASTYERLVAEYPEHVEAWYQLGDLRFHQNPYHGRSVREGRRGLERVLGMPDGPTVREAEEHLTWLAGLDRDARELDSLARRLRRRNPSEGALRGVRVLQAILARDEAAIDAAVSELRRVAEIPAIILAWRVQVFGGDLELGERMARALTEPWRPPAMRAWGHLTVADLALARGRLAEARRALDAAAEAAPLRALEAGTFYESLPHVPVRPDRLRALRDSLLALEPGRYPPGGGLSPPFEDFYEDARDGVRLYVAGLASARLGDAATADRLAERLERFSVSTATAPELAPTASEPAGAALEPAALYARWFAAGIRARLAWERGDAAATLAALAAGEVDLPRDYGPVHFASGGPERWLRAEALRALGRRREALRRHEALFEIAATDFVFLGPSLLSQGRILEAAGDSAEAARRYLRLVELWAECDQAFVPLRAEAERALARGKGGRGASLPPSTP